jgi:hypothetical protein
MNWVKEGHKSPRGSASVDQPAAGQHQVAPQVKRELSAWVTVLGATEIVWAHGPYGNPRLSVFQSPYQPTVLHAVSDEFRPLFLHDAQ